MDENIYEMLRAYKTPTILFFLVHSKWDQIRPIRLHEITKITLFMLSPQPLSTPAPNSPADSRAVEWHEIRLDPAQMSEKIKAICFEKWCWNCCIQLSVTYYNSPPGVWLIYSLYATDNQLVVEVMPKKNYARPTKNILFLLRSSTTEYFSTHGFVGVCACVCINDANSCMKYMYTQRKMLGNYQYEWLKKIYYTVMVNFYAHNSLWNELTYSANGKKIILIYIFIWMTWHFFPRIKSNLMITNQRLQEWKK